MENNYKTEEEWQKYCASKRDELIRLYEKRMNGEKLNLDNPQTITDKINWCNYGDNDLLGNENNNDRHLVNRFIKPTEDNNENIEIKTIVNLHKYLPKFRIPHNPVNAINCYDADGNRCENKPILKKAYINVKLNHYRKTIIEYIEHKYNRGFADGNSTPCDFNLFFRYSKRTPEKEEIINKFLQKQK